MVQIGPRQMRVPDPAGNRHACCFLAYLLLLSRKSCDENSYAYIISPTAEIGNLLTPGSPLDDMRNTKSPLLMWQGIAWTDGS